MMCPRGQNTDLRLGAVSYLNMRPLVSGLEDLAADGLSLIEAPPSQLARMLEAGQIDMGMVPVAAIFDHPEWIVAPKTMIGMRGAVRSVILTGFDEPHDWRVLRPDAHSKTSNALARVFLERRLGLHPHPGKPVPIDDSDPADRLQPGEAMVLIGSRALRSWQRLRERGATILDMGTVWRRWTGLPFVCALWAIRPGAPVQGWLQRIEEVKLRNRKRLGSLAAKWPGLAFDRLTRRQAADYLRRNVDFDFDAAARRGLLRFYNEGRAIGLFAPDWRLRLTDDPLLAPLSIRGVRTSL